MVLHYQCAGIIPLQLQEGRYKVFVILQRNGLCWVFPKGHLKEDESLQEGAKRELKEETGLIIDTFLDIPPFLQSYSIEKKSGHVLKDVTYFVAMVKGMPLVQMAEVLTGKWVDLETAASFLTFEANQQMCNPLIDMFCNV